MKRNFSPSSLRHLILLGFFVSLIPLGLLVWQSNSIQRKVSESSIDFTISSINSVRLAVEMDNLLVDIERGIRQFFVLQSDSLKELTKQNFNSYVVLLQEFCINRLLKVAQFCEYQKSDVVELEETYMVINSETVDELILRLRTQQTTMVEDLWLYLETSTEKQQVYAQQQQRRISYWLVGISVVTFILVVLISGRVAAPVKQLEEKINAIGTSQKGETADVDFSGPYELRNIFEKLQWLEARLAQLEALRQSFLRHASHEFKTPLSSIKEGCSILSEELTGPLKPQQKEIIILLVESTHRLQRLTEQLLDYNYFLQQQEPNYSEISLVSLFADIKRNHDLAFNQRQQLLTIDCSIKMIRTDRILFTRIIENLLGNAQAYGAQAGKVLVQLQLQGEYLSLLVGNTGPRIASSHRRHLLEPFYRADNPRYDSVRGSGLGLSIVSDCARLLGGQVELIDIENYDFAAKVTLPV